MNTAALPVPALREGSRVALVAPSGPLRDAGDLARAEATCRALGLEPVAMPHVLARAGYLAGTDAERIADLDAAFRDPGLDAVWCVRGGYGLTRILDAIDYDALGRRPRAVIGFSDITALHCAVAVRTGLVTFHGPTARQQLSPFSVARLRRVLFGESPRLDWPVAPDNLPGADVDAVTCVSRGRATGRLVGGNLAMLASLAGTPFFPSLDGALLFLEDVGEHVYRTDRMLAQLRLAGALDRVAGVLVGRFTEIPDAADAPPLAALWSHYFGGRGVPVLTGVPIGHVEDQWTLPVGALATLDADARTLVIESPITC